MVSLPCTSGCPWHRVNLKSEVRHTEKSWRAKLWSLANSSTNLRNTRTLHCRVVIMLPLNGPGVPTLKRPEVKRFFNDPRFKVVDFDGCRLGVCNDKGEPVKKPWRIMTTSDEVVKSFTGLTCQHQAHEHGEARGRSLENTGFYTQPMCELLARAFNPRLASQ